MSKHQRQEHEYGPPWCSECRTVWPCQFAEQES